MATAGPEVKAGPVNAPVIPVLLIALGGYLAWFGVHYWRQDERWPSDPIKAALQGKGLPASAPPPAVSASLSADISSTAAAEGGGPAAADAGGSAYQGSLPAGSAQNTAKLLLAKFGWAPAQMASLITLWTRESGWSPTARNPSSGAFGIAQALGHGTSCSAAPDGTNEYGPDFGLTCAEAQQANAGSVRWQIEWGLAYIKATYGSPAAALAHENAHNWY
jgi:colicin import membrane protein